MINRQKHTFRQKNLVLGIASALLLSASGALYAGDSETIRIDIEEQAAGTSLTQLAKAAGVQIVMNKSVGEGVSLPAVYGDYTLTQALNIMLEGTGMNYEITSDNLIVIQADEDSEQGSEQEDSSKKEKDVDEEIVVTGTRLKLTVNQLSSQLIILDAQALQDTGAAYPGGCAVTVAAKL